MQRLVQSESPSGLLCLRTGESAACKLQIREFGLQRSRDLLYRSQLAAGAKYGQFSSREKSHGFSPEKR